MAQKTSSAGAVGANADTTLAGLISRASAVKKATWCHNGAAMLVMDRQNRFMVVQREENRMWEIPTGGVEDGESSIEAAVRETHSETGLLLRESDIFLAGEFEQRVPERDDKGVILREKGQPILHKGTLLLYCSNRLYNGEQLEAEIGEVRLIRFMNARHILIERGNFTLASLRLIFGYMNIQYNVDEIPVVGALKSQVIWRDGTEEHVF